MPLFLGHYLGNPKEWFLAWGADKMEAAQYVDDTLGEPDLRSMKRVRGPGMVGFKAKLARDGSGEDDDEYAELRLNPKEIDLGMSGGSDENDAWIVKRLKKPLGPPKTRELSFVAQQLGVEQPEILLGKLPPEDRPKPDKRLRR